MNTEKLGNIIKLTKGKKHLETDDISTSRYLQIEDVNGSENLKYTAEKGVKVNSDDIILVWDGANAGKVGIGLNGVIGSTLSRMSIDTKSVYPKYLYWFLQSKFDFIKSQRTGATIPHVSTSSINTLPIPMFDLPDQQRIATILDHADSIRRKNKQILDKYNELAQSVFYEMFGDPLTNPNEWVKKKLIDVCKKITDGTHHSPSMHNYGIPYVTAKHVKKYGLDFEINPTYISEEDHRPIFKRCPAEYGDVLYIKDGATTGIAAINTFRQEVSLLSSLALLKPDLDQISSDYLCSWLNNENVKAKLILVSMAGAAIQRFTLDKIKNFVIQIPDLNLQTRFSEIIQDIDRQRKLTQVSLDKSEDLFQSLLQRAFKGEL